MTRPDRESSPPTSSREGDRERALAEVLADASARDEAFRRPAAGGRRADRWKTSLAALLLALAAWVGAAPPAWLSPGPAPRLRPGDVERGLRADLYLEAREIDAFRMTHGRLPYALDELPERASGVRFVRSDSRVYQLVARRADGSLLVYDSARPAPGFGAVASEWGTNRHPR